MPIERDDVSVERGHEQPIAVSGKAPVARPAAHFQTGRQLTLIPPQLLAGPPVDRPSVVVHAGDIERPVYDDRSGFELVDRVAAGNNAGLKRPERLQFANIGRSNFS